MKQNQLLLLMNVAGQADKESTKVRRLADFRLVLLSFSRGDIICEGRNERLMETEISGISWFAHFLLAYLSLERCSRRTSYKPGAEGVARAGLDVRGHKLSKEDASVEHKVSLKLLVFKRDRCLGEGSMQETAEDKGIYRAQRLRRNVTSWGGYY